MQTLGEPQKHHVHKFTRNNGFLHIYMQCNWNSGCIWSYNACIDVAQLATEPADSRRHATTAA